MASVVLDVDIAREFCTYANLHHYSHAFVLLRKGNVPVGQCWLIVRDGQITAGKLDEASRALGARALPAAVPLPGGAPLATVAVCTRDRPDDLRNCLASLLCLPNDGQELLIIDNCPSTDATAQIVAQYPQVRYVREDQAGLNNARNRALREARHDIVAFIDDDARADKEWLRGLLRNFDSPLIYAVTGLTAPYELETPAQEWFERYSSFNRGFTRRIYDSSSISPTSAGVVGSGVNMALRRTALHELGPFHGAFDAGTPAHSGGDNEMFTRILTAGYQIVYDPAALNWHRHRRNWPDLRQTLYGYGVGVYAAYTHSLLTRHELGVFASAWGWFAHRQFPMLRQKLLNQAGSTPLDLLLSELWGCCNGPAAYLRSCKQLRAAIR